MSVAQIQRITPNDRLGMTLFFAVLLHAIIVLGVTFKALDDDSSAKSPPLEITLVQSKSEVAPDKADYLAQANQEGGGNTREKLRPSSPTAKPFTAPVPDRAEAFRPQQQAAPSKPQVIKNTMDTKRSSFEVETRPKEVNEQYEERLLPNASELITSSMEVASLNAELNEQQQLLSSDSRVKHISANTREYKYASYMEAWRAKVERIGNINYPEAAKRRSLTGNLVLDVVLNPDGTVNNILVRRSSGNKLLDDAAVRIVRLAAPYAPFPENIRKEVDVLVISRTWQFLDNNRLRSR